MREIFKKCILIILTLLLSPTSISYACGKTETETFKECVESYKLGAYDICAVTQNTIKHYISKEACAEILQNLKRLKNVVDFASALISLTGGAGKVLAAAIAAGACSIDELEWLNNKGCGIVVIETVKMCESHQINLLSPKCQILPMTTHRFTVIPQ